MTRPRVGVLTSSFPSEPGDPAGAFVEEHVRWLCRRGCRVEVVAARPGAPALAPDVPVARLPFGARLFSGPGAPEVLAGGRGRVDAALVSAAMLAAARLRRRRWDRIVAHWLVPAGLIAAAVAGGRPVRAIAHSGDVHLVRRLGLGSVVAAALWRGGARISFVSESLRELFVREVRPRALRRAIERISEVTPMGVEVERFQRAVAGRRSPPRHVAFLGRLVPIKGGDVAVEAARLWKADAPLAIAGAGPEEARLRARAAAFADGTVELRGEVRGSVRDDFLAGARALVVPSRRLPDGRTEGMPVVALEAMAAAVPVIGSAVGGLTELPERVACLVPPADPAALARAVDRLLADERARERQVQEAAAFVRSRDWSAVGPRLW